MNNLGRHYSQRLARELFRRFMITFAIVSFICVIVGVFIIVGYLVLKFGWR